MGSEIASLTDLEREALREAAKGIDLVTACRIAGYADPASSAASLRRSGKFRPLLAAAVREFLYTEAAPAAVRLMYDFMMNEQVDKRIRLAAAKTIADRAGFIAPKAKENKDLDGKALTEMTAEEMRDMARRIQKELSDRAVVVIDNEPSSVATQVQAPDMFD